MTTNLKQAIEEMEGDLARANQDCKENADFPNSYGAGYDNGVRDTLIDALKILKELDAG